jgi:methylisocitrate lyase
MVESHTTSLRRRFRELLARPELTLVPGAYDALSARIIEREGFDAVVAGGYAAIGSMLAQPDTGQCNMRDYADHYGRIAAAISVPLFVDGDTGFGGVHNVRQMVRGFEAAGVAGLFVGDQVFPNRCGYLPGKKIVPLSEMLAKVKSALNARQDPNLVIVARTDAAAVEGLDAAVERAHLFMEAGADAAMVIGADRLEDIQRLKRELPGPQFATISQAAGRNHTALKDLEAAGVSAAFFPSAALFAAAEAVRRVMATLHQDRTIGARMDDLMALDDYYGLVGLAAQNADEQRFEEEASQLIAARTRNDAG